MNLTHSRLNISRACACNDCIYNSQEKDPNNHLNGSRIDKLYYDQYLPLRERKLIDKLVRTRGVYDDIRNRILSQSIVDITKAPEYYDETSSLETKADSNTNSAVQKLVDLVDRREYPPLQSSVHLHSDCCGCCICSSKTLIQKPYKVHMHIPNQDHIDRYVESHHHKMRKEERQVGFNAIRSDQCLCTLKFSKSPKKLNFNKIKASKKSVNKTTDVGKLITCKCTYDAAKPTISKRSIVLLKNAENKVRESIRSTVTKIENVFHIKKDSLMIFRDKLKKQQDMKAWECDPNFCIPYECNPDECYQNVKRREAKNSHQKAYHHNVPDIMQKVKAINAENQEPPTGYELKRCFCTQQLQKPQKNKPKQKLKINKIPKTTMTKSKADFFCKCEVKDSVSAQTNKESLTKPSKKETLAIESVPVIERKAHDLLPYECEQHFCIPDKCNAIVCNDRIKHRNQKNKIISKDTNTLEMPQKTKRKRTHQPKPLHLPIAEKSKSSPNAQRKQAVRISSSFRFDIEFFKEKNFPDSMENSNTTRNKQREKSISNNIEEYREHTKNKLLTEVNINHDKEQTNIISTTPLDKNHNKASEDLFLKRCFCTLKLHKTPKPKQKRPKSKMTMTAKEKKEKSEQVTCKCENIDMDCICEPEKISIESQSSMTTAVVNYVLPSISRSPSLLPYECEPLFCTPGKCDPIVCENRIKVRNKRPRTLTKEVNTELKKSTKTITPISAASVKKVKEVQVPKLRKTKTKEELKTEILLPYADKPKSAPNATNRKAVKISSSFRFDIEFYKDQTNPNDDGAIQQEEQLPSISKFIKEAKQKQKNVEPQTNKKVKSIVAITQPLIKCLCKLILQKKRKPKMYKHISKKTMTTNSETVKINVCACKNMSTQTKKVIVKPPVPQIPGLLPYECEPNICIPGKCDPLICEERIKMRNKIEEDKEVSRLKRCFCTLKFHNDNNVKRKRTVIPLHNNFDVTSVKSVATDTNKIKIQKKDKHNLLPHECDPGVCVPGQCDPFECLKLIKKRNTVETTQQTKVAITKKQNIVGTTHSTKYANTENPKIKSVFNAAKDFKKVKKTQATKVNTQKENDNVKKIEKQLDNNPVSPYNSCQSVKFSSECSFGIEFRKNKMKNGRLGKDKKRASNIKPKIGVKITRETHKKNSELATESLAKEGESLTNIFQLEKCFCTLKLHKKGHQHARHNQTGKTPKFMKQFGQQQI